MTVKQLSKIMKIGDNYVTLSFSSNNQGVAANIVSKEEFLNICRANFISYDVDSNVIQILFDYFVALHNAAEGNKDWLFLFLIQFCNDDVNNKCDKFFEIAVLICGDGQFGIKVSALREFLARYLMICLETPDQILHSFDMIKQNSKVTYEKVQDVIEEVEFNLMEENNVEQEMFCKKFRSKPYFFEFLAMRKYFL